ncbi:MAG: hypothetical protein KOO63_07870 [Bacteroidales bacterium]|nr:hypothetical protein [Candidatus Latescibacterota bacterium]
MFKVTMIIICATVAVLGIALMISPPTTVNTNISVGAAVPALLTVELGQVVSETECVWTVRHAQRVMELASNTVVHWYGFPGPTYGRDLRLKVGKAEKWEKVLLETRDRYLKDMQVLGTCELK